MNHAFQWTKKSNTLTTGTWKTGYHLNNQRYVKSSRKRYWRTKNFMIWQKKWKKKRTRDEAEQEKQEDSEEELWRETSIDR